MATFAPADSTLGRVDRMAMTDINVSTASQLAGYMGQTLTNKRLILAAGTYQGFFEQTGEWTNVEVFSLNRAAKITTSGSTAWIFQGRAARTRVSVNGVAFESTLVSTSLDYSLFWWNELPVIDGLEVAYCSFTNPNNNANAMGCSSYSMGSNSGAVSRNVYIHHNNFERVGRAAIELLSQGYDGVYRLINLSITNNTFTNMGMSTANDFGPAMSLSGLMRQIDISNNVSNESKKFAYELVNVRDVNAYNNNATSTAKNSVGWGISDDNQNVTDNIYINGGVLDVSARPFYVYGATGVHINGENKQWKGHQRVDLNSSNCSYTKMNLLIHSTLVEACVVMDYACHHILFTDSVVSAAGAVAAGYQAQNQVVLLTNATHDIVCSNVTTIGAKKADGTTWLAPSAGGQGQIVNYGTNNTITNNNYSVAN